MLVLTRKVGEHITIGNDTVVLIQAISRKRVRLAIEAPRLMRILRGELYPLEECASIPPAQSASVRVHRSLTGIING